MFWLCISCRISIFEVWFLSNMEVGGEVDVEKHWQIINNRTWNHLSIEIENYSFIYPGRVDTRAKKLVNFLCVLFLRQSRDFKNKCRVSDLQKNRKWNFVLYWDLLFIFWWLLFRWFLACCLNLLEKWIKQHRLGRIRQKEKSQKKEHGRNWVV